MAFGFFIAFGCWLGLAFDSALELSSDRGLALSDMNLASFDGTSCHPIWISAIRCEPPASGRNPDAIRTGSLSSGTGLQDFD